MEWESEKPGDILKNLESFRQSMEELQERGPRCYSCNKRTHNTILIKCGMFLYEVGACKSCQENHDTVSGSIEPDDFPSAQLGTPYLDPDETPPKPRGYDHSKFSKTKRNR